MSGSARDICSGAPFGAAGRLRRLGLWDGRRRRPRGGLPARRRSWQGDYAAVVQTGVGGLRHRGKIELRPGACAGMPDGLPRTSWRTKTVASSGGQYRCRRWSNLRGCGKAGRCGTERHGARLLGRTLATAAGVGRQRHVGCSAPAMRARARRAHPVHGRSRAEPVLPRPSDPLALRPKQRPALAGLPSRFLAHELTC